MLRRKPFAVITLIAMLFSAVSPALAAFALRDTPSALRQILGLSSEQTRLSRSHEHAEHSHHHDSTASDDHARGGEGVPGHATHGIYCSFCLNPSSVAGIAPAPVSLTALSLEFAVVLPATVTEYFSRFVSVYRSRAPPAHS